MFIVVQIDTRSPRSSSSTLFSVTLGVASRRVCGCNWSCRGHQVVLPADPWPYLGKVFWGAENCSLGHPFSGPRTDCATTLTHNSQEKQGKARLKEGGRAHLQCVHSEFPSLYGILQLIWPLWVNSIAARQLR